MPITLSGAGSADKIELVTSTNADVDFVAAWVDDDGVADREVGTITAAGTNTIVPAPGATNERAVRYISVRNVDTTSQTITVQLDEGGTEYELYEATLRAGWSCEYSAESGWSVYDAAGARIAGGLPLDGYMTSAYKVGTTAEAAGVRHALATMPGNPGAWSSGSPGLNGRATDGTDAADAGCFPLRTPAVGENYLVQMGASATTIQAVEVYDWLWVNSGIVSATTGIQSISAPVALPARDINGTSAGEGCQVALWVSTGGNNAAITTTTIGYTNSAGTGSRVGTIASFPATAQTGTFVLFTLQAGDTGVQQIDSITLGTTYGTTVIQLVILRKVAMTFSVNANQRSATALGGIKLHAGSCLLPSYVATTTTATTLDIDLAIEIR